jgi:inner membrane transporter RhtA
MAAPQFRRQMPPELYFVGSAVFHYLGPAFAVLLFTRIEPLGVAWLRIVTAGAVFAVWRRPWRAWNLASRGERRHVIVWGVLLGSMNASFYLAIARLPLGTVAAVEFAGPIVLAAVGVRSRRNVTELVLVLAGVCLLAEVTLNGSPVGFGFAVANMALFSGYIIVAHRVSRQERLAGIDGLAMAMLVAAVVAAPIGILDAAPAFTDVASLGAAIGVGVTSSVIPYVLDQLAMRRIARSTYALMVALLPAMATVIGIVVLAQVPTLLELLGVSLVIAGVAIHRERQTTELEVRVPATSSGNAHGSAGADRRLDLGRPAAGPPSPRRTGRVRRTR